MTVEATTEEYRLRWETCDPHQAEATEAAYGRGCWPRVDWSKLRWHESERIATEGDILDQHQTLKEWADTRTEPIRNVRLEVRPAPNPDAGWQEA